MEKKLYYKLPSIPVEPMFEQEMYAYQKRLGKRPATSSSSIGTKRIQTSQGNVKAKVSKHQDSPSSSSKMKKDTEEVLVPRRSNKPKPSSSRDLRPVYNLNQDDTSSEDNDSGDEDAYHDDPSSEDDTSSGDGNPSHDDPIASSNDDSDDPVPKYPLSTPQEPLPPLQECRVSDLIGSLGSCGSRKTKFLLDDIKKLRQLQVHVVLY
jgi:hypothetical protein